MAEKVPELSEFADKFVNDTSIDDNPPHFIMSLMGALPCCGAVPAPQHAMFHAAHAVFLAAYVAPNTRGGLLVMHGLLIAGFLVYGMWAWNIACARDVFSWGFSFTVINLGQTLYVLYQTRPVKTDKELEAVYHTLFRPLNVERLVFKRLVSSECCQVSSLHAGEAYALEGLTRTDRLGLLLSGKVTVSSAGQVLHSVGPMQFLDSPEFESSRAAIDDKFKVSIIAATTSRYLFWKRSSLEHLFLKDQHLTTVLSTLVARDITTKLYCMNEKIVTEKGSHLDIRLPSLTASLNPTLVVVPHTASPSLSPVGTTEVRTQPNWGEGAAQRAGFPTTPVGGGFGAPLGYSNSSAAELLSSDGITAGNGAPPANKMEHPLH
ncbi:popeye domain-containing protein 3 [Hyalella azteca]|uniref:Popeye domain-containing protein 3 n=1 Tax=Hyalella azteca TaxID=294128 RepID=A0A8B7N3H3_HYAAZ|nr:popeye domain-containing protein 3 [Hyalella azteca]